MTDGSLTIAAVADNPELATFTITRPGASTLRLRPLLADDVDALAAFLQSLSATTRHFSVFPSYDEVTARALCDAINRYDKLRFVVEFAKPGAAAPSPSPIIGLVEFSFDLTARDLQRYAGYGIALDAQSCCRFGPVLADAVQDQGIGSRVFPYVVEVARRFGRSRIILWGGVLAENARAIHFYTKHGFVYAGSFSDSEGLTCHDMWMDLPAAIP